MESGTIICRDLGIEFAINRRRRLRARDLFIRPERGGLAGESFWALRHLDLQVAPGEAVGVVGANGAGKSTLFRIVSGVLLPDEGEVRVAGAVAPLLDLSAAFSTNLSARDNVTLTGALHGVDGDLAEERFDDIMAFSELERFVDTPVKHYSRGMKARLGFAVMVALDHPILVVDEALAVGDKQFKAKCYAEMERMLADGKTVLLSSHRDSDITRFCSRAVYLRDGRIVEDGAPRTVLKQYAAELERA